MNWTGGSISGKWPEDRPAQNHFLFLSPAQPLLATGRYLSVLPRSLMQFADLRSTLKVLPVKLPIEPRPVAIITLKDRTLSPVASLFIACARDIVKPLAQTPIAMQPS